MLTYNAVHVHPPVRLHALNYVMLVTQHANTINNDAEKETYRIKHSVLRTVFRKYCEHVFKVVAGRGGEKSAGVHNEIKEFWKGVLAAYATIEIGGQAIAAETRPQVVDAAAHIEQQSNAEHVSAAMLAAKIAAEDTAAAELAVVLSPETTAVFSGMQNSTGQSVQEAAEVLSLPPLELTTNPDSTSSSNFMEMRNRQSACYGVVCILQQDLVAGRNRND